MRGISTGGWGISVSRSGENYLSAVNGAFDHYGNADDYDYDKIGNITDLSGTAYTYAQSGNAGPHAPTGVGSVVFTYDPNGNRYTATDGSDVTSYGYDPDNRMTSIDLPNTADDLVFDYDTDGQRVRRSAGTDHTALHSRMK